MKLTMLGTGHATVTDCYNTCFVIEDDKKYFLVDGGGGNGILRQLKAAEIDWRDIKDIFITHKHADHILGIVWIIRMICQSMREEKYSGEVNIYAHDEVIKILKDITSDILSKKETDYIGQQIHLIVLSDGDTKNIIGKCVTFFDIHSTKAKQFGFVMKLNNKDKLTCCGDEPYNESEKEYALNSRWLLHEAFCLDSQAEKYNPYEKHHSTVKDACVQAENLHAENLIIYHTEDDNLSNRKDLYTDEGKTYFKGRLYIPDDLDEFLL